MKKEQSSLEEGAKKCKEFMTQETNSNREKLIPIEQSSLEKSLGKLVLIEHLTKEQQTELYNFVNKQLADQKQKIREFWEIKYNSFILGGRYQRLHTSWWISAMKDFEEL